MYEIPVSFLLFQNNNKLNQQYIFHCINTLMYTKPSIFKCVDTEGLNGI